MNNNQKMLLQKLINIKIQIILCLNDYTPLRVIPSTLTLFYASNIPHISVIFIF